MNIEDAISLACFYHAGQYDKNHQPYILHPLRVMLALNSVQDRIVAVLHDVLEDTDCPEGLLESRLPKPCFDALKAITKVEGEPYKTYLKRVKANQIARRVKVADVRDNASPARLYLLDPDTVMRLTKKYLEALKYLGE